MGIETQIELDGQYRALREGVGLVDRSHRGKLVVGGPDAAEFLQGQLTNDVEALEPGRGCYAALLDRKGRMQADMRVLRLAGGDGFWLDVEAAGTAAVARHLSTYRLGRQVEVSDAGAERRILALVGPGAPAVVAAPLRPEHAHREVEVGGVACLAVATDLGIDLVLDVDGSAAVESALAGSGVVEVSPEAAEIVRVESGRPRFGREMTTATIPEEAGINDRAVSFTKGCYIGQETVARLHYKGKPNRHLRGLRLDAPAAAGDAVFLGDREVGRVGTAVVSPARGPLALAILRREAGPGERVAVGDAGIGAEVVAPETGWPEPAPGR